ncbi:MAG: FAD-dependent oxidoreductase [Gemmatimonadota bacterium]
MSSSDFYDIVVLGDGIVGLACARATAARGLATCLVGRRRPGVASIAAAGFLAPTVEPVRGRAFQFTLSARDRYRSFLDELRDVTGLEVPFALDGVLRIAATEREAATLAKSADSSTHWRSASEIAELEPALHAPFGGLVHAGDGMVDNQRLMGVLDAAVAAQAIPRHDAQATRVELVGDEAVLHLDTGARIRSRHLIIAAGAWAPHLPGLPRPLPIRPLRGQMMALAAAPALRRPVFGHGGYVVPRTAQRQVMVGSTAETVGFTTGTTDAALAGFRVTATRLVPSLARADEVRTWCGFRPMTLDGLPIIGADPDAPAILYAAGHSRNGILLAPLTGDVVAALAAGDPPGHDLSPFAMSRFSRPAGVKS